MKKVYVIEYRYLVDKERGIWGSKVSQEGYDTLKKAQAFVEGRANNPGKCSEFYYQTALHEEYCIHEIIIK